jgi:3-hexulose-6-phosphate synthase/6-phospho-3-hexuloisomerase
MKVMDTGSLEIEMASKAGSDVITILAASDDSTIKEALKSARKYGTKLMVDLIGVKEKILRAQQLEALDVDYLCIHVGIDEQMRGKKPIDVLKSIVQNTSVPVAVAGGLNSETVSEVVQAGAYIIIVGGAITKAKDVTRSVHLIKQAMMTRTPIETTLFKKYDSTHLRKAFNLVSTPNISDAMHKMGAMKEIRPIKLGFHMIGRALTVKTIDGDWAKPIDAIDRGKKDTVITVDVNGGRTAVWGELATWSAKKRGIRGVVIDGAVRDLDDLLKINFPIFCRYISSNAGEPKGFGEIGAEIICGGQTVQNGDWIIGDDSGVVVVPQQNAQEIANRALDVKEQENRIREEIKSGGSLGRVLKVKKWEKKIG